MPEVTDMTKAPINTLLAPPLSTSQRKKKTRAEDRTPPGVLDNSEFLSPRKARGTEDRILVQPSTDPDKISPIRAGTKRHLMADALASGTTLEHLTEVTGWSRSVVSAALYTDVNAAGLGIKRKACKLHLILPKGVKGIPVRNTAA